jgi:pilus assembly protein Flp/PilA
LRGASGAGPQKEQKNMTELLKSLVRDEQGQDLIEYGLLAGFISIIAIAAITSVGNSLNTVFTKVATQTAAAAN